MLPARPKAWLGLLLALFCCGGVSARAATDSELLDLLPEWNYTLDVTTGVGYKDNVTLSALRPEGSAFFHSSLEFFLLRWPIEGPEFHWLVSAEDTRYWEIPSVDKEQMFFTQAQARQAIGDFWKASLALDYVYQDQILDVSITETNPAAVRVLGHNLQATPGLRWEATEESLWEFTLPVARRAFNAPLDDYWEGGPLLEYSRNTGAHSEWRLRAGFTFRRYDRRRPLDASGEPVAGQHLEYYEPRLEWRWRVDLDTNRIWRYTLRLDYRHNLDNGGGYFDYWRPGLAQELRFRKGNLEVEARLQLAYYEYPIQPADLEGGGTRQRLEVGAGLRWEWRLVAGARLYAEYGYERTLEHALIDRYAAHTVGGGVIWEF